MAELPFSICFDFLAVFLQPTRVNLITHEVWLFNSVCTGMLVSLFVLIYADYLLFLYLSFSFFFLLFSSGNDRVGWQEKMEELKFFF